MIVKNEFLDRLRTHLPVLAEVYRCTSKAIRLTAGIQAVHVRFGLCCARPSVEDWRADESEYRDNEDREGKHGEIANAANLPFLTPAFQTPLQRPEQQGEEDHINHGEEQDVLVDVIQDIVSHLMAHDGLDLLGRSAPQQVVVQRDAHRPAESADIGAHAGGLFRCIDRPYIPRRNAVSVRHCEDRGGNLWIIESLRGVEDRLNEDRADEDKEDRKDNGDTRAPNPPGSRE